MGKAKADLDFSLQQAIAGSSYESWLDFVRWDHLPKYYVLKMQPDVLTRLLEDRRSVNALTELLPDFHLAIMNRSPHLMARVDTQPGRFGPGLDADRQGFKVMGTYPPFLAPVPLLGLFTNVYKDLYSGESSVTTGSHFSYLECGMNQWLQLADVAPCEGP